MSKEATDLPHISGIVIYSDDRPAAGATVAFTEITTGTQIATVKANHQGSIKAPIKPGDYAVAVAAKEGAVWIEKQTISSDNITIRLSNDCTPVSGTVLPNLRGTQVHFGRRSFATGDTFVTEADMDGSFSCCLPRGEYIASLKGSVLSLGTGVTVPAPDVIHLQGYAKSDVYHAPKAVPKVAHDIDKLIDDIVRSGAMLIGLGEATHGSAEFVTTRARLTFALARRAQVHLVLLENDAMATFELERYVAGEDVDLLKAISKLGFWMTDTYEFSHFIEQIREYNRVMPSTERIHIAGIDAQNTELPANLLLSNATALHMSEDDKELLHLIAPDRGKAVKQFSPQRRRALDVLLLRLSTPASASDPDIRFAVAARSLAVQVTYFDGDAQAMYISRRDAGMAQLASFIIQRTGVRRAVLWAHDDHISRTGEGSESMGYRLAKALFDKYYPIGFYLFEGTSRAWDAAGKVGVVSHTIHPAPPYTAEGVLMAASGASDAAWLPFRQLPPALQKWLEIPRFVREFGAVYYGGDRSMVLFDLRAAFDALVVVRSVHDSSPTPTGVRRAGN